MTGKVFGLGLSRTGTLSLCQALHRLGIHVVHYPRLDELPDSVSGCDGAVDTPVICRYRELDEQFPGSRFILTTRDKESWLTSTERFFARAPASEIEPWQLEVRRLVYGTDDWERAAFSAAYDTHIADVTAYFAQRPTDLLVLDIVGGEGWEKLCPFLGRPIPPVPFPHKHRQDP